jgi:hypothetical protein
MIWKAIGQSVIGSSHTANGKGCEDASAFRQFELEEGGMALLSFVSDGAGSAKHAAEAAQAAVDIAVEFANGLLKGKVDWAEKHLIALAETVYEQLQMLSQQTGDELNEYSCTLLGCIILPQRACFIQIGDGAIVRNDGDGHFTTIWWPHNGEYQNTTAFLIDDPGFRHLKIKIIDERVDEIALFTDGLQMLALVNETESVHQPFFANLFKWLRQVEEPSHLDILDLKLTDYLSGELINNRTDDDKTLVLATRLRSDLSQKTEDK